MSQTNFLAENCVLEVGEVTGTKDFTTETQTGTTTTVKFIGCKDKASYFDQGFNIVDPYMNRVCYTGVVPALNSFLGGTLQEAIGVGCISQGCLLTYLATWNGNQFEPGTNIDDNKIIYSTLYKNSSYAPVGLVWLSPFPITSNHFVPYNAQGQGANPQGRSIYYTHNSNTIGSSNNVTKREGVVFDVMGKAAGDDILLMGNGSDYMDDYSLICPDLWNAPEDYSWYISAYMHSHNWDSSLGSGQPFHWIGGSLSVRTEIGSYEGSLYRDTSLNVQKNQCYDSEGLLGLRSDYWGDMAGTGGADCFQVEISISQITNATLSVLEGNPDDTNITSIPGQMMKFHSPGVYTVCLSALKRSAIWNDTAYSGGLLQMDGNRAFDWADGAVNLVEAKAIDNSIPARLTLDYIKVTKQDPDFQTTTEPIMTSVVNYTVDQLSWNHLDIFDSEAMPLSLTYSIGSLKDLTKRAAGYSKTFMIPANQHNVQILEPMLAVGAVRTKIDWQPCRVSVDGVNVFKGLLRVEEGVSGNGGAFSCHIIEDSIDWTNLLEDLTICDVAIIEEDSSKQEKSYDNIVSSWDNDPHNGDSYHFGLVNYGEWNAESLNTTSTPDYQKNSMDFHPSIFAYSLIHKIFQGIGYTLESNFIESPTFAKLCHPYSSGEEYIETDLFDANGSQYTRVARSAKTTAAGSFSSGGKCPHGATRYWYPNIVLGTDVGNNWNGNSATTGYTIPFTGDYSIMLNSKLYVSQNNIANGSNTYMGTQLMINSSIISSGSGWIGGQIVHNSTSGASNGVSGTSTHVRTLNAGDVISYRVIGVNNSSVWDMWGDAAEMVMSVYPVVSAIIPDYNFNLSKILPCTKQMDYLKGLTELFNLQWTADKELKKVKVEPYNQFFGSGKVVDWTGKIDTTSWSDNYIIKELAQSVTFKYKKDTKDKGIAGLYNWREQNGLTEYKSYTELNEKRFRKEVLELGSTVFSSTYRFNNYGLQPNPNQHSNTHPYAPNAYAWGDLSWQNPYSYDDNPLMPVMWDETGGQINGDFTYRPSYNPTPKFGLRILNYYGKQDCVNYFFLKSDNTVQMTNKYPYMDWINGWDKGNQIDYYNLSWDDYNDGYGYTSPGLFSKYWQHAYNKMNGGAMLRTCTVALTAEDINLFDYTDLVHVKIDGVSTYWTVQRIKDYMPNKKQLTEVDLIEWKYDQNYSPRNNSKKRSIKVGSVEGEETIAYLSRSDTRKSNKIDYKEKRNDTLLGESGLSVNSKGEIVVGADELIVQSEDGTICNLVYTDKEDLKKLYLKKEEIQEIDRYGLDVKKPYIDEQDDNNC
jgi:hypothetical protein